MTVTREKQDKDKLRDYQNLEKDFTKLNENHRLLIEDYNRERVLRKKYHNQVRTRSLEKWSNAN